MTEIPMITHDDWLKAGIVDGRLEMRYDLSGCVHMDFDAAADYTARLISERYPKIYVLYSGGYDSEYVCKVLLRNNITFTPLIYENPFCSEEFGYAKLFCDQNQIEPTIIKPNLSEICKYARLVYNKYGLDFFPNSMAYIFASKLLTADAILLDGQEPIHGDDDGLVSKTTPIHHSQKDFLIDFLMPGKCVHFLLYTRELYLSMLETTMQSDEHDIQRFKGKLYGLLYRPKLRNDEYTFYDHWFKINEAVKEIMAYKKNKDPDAEDFFASEDNVRKAR